MVFLAFQVIGARADVPGGGEWTNVATGGTATASTYKSGYDPSKAIDADAATYWKATKTTGWVAVRFTGVAAIAEVHLVLVGNAFSSLELYLDTNNDGAYGASERVWTTTSNAALTVKVPLAATNAYGVKINFPVAMGGSKYPQVGDLAAFSRADTDKDGLTNDYERVTVYYYRTSASGLPVLAPSFGSTSVPLQMNALSGVPFRGLAEAVVTHVGLSGTEAPPDVTLSIGYLSGGVWTDRVAWDPNGWSEKPTITYPTPGLYFGPSVNVIATVPSPSTVARMEFFIDAEAVAKGTVTVPSGNAYTWTWTTSGYADGTHTIRARSVDIWGASFNASVPVGVDRVAPSVSITSPANGATIQSTSTTVSWSISASGAPVSSVATRIDAGTWTTVTGSSSRTFTGLSYATHIVDVKATDTVGNQGTGSVTFTNAADTTPPTVSISGPTQVCPDYGATLDGSASDPTGLRYVSFFTAYYPNGATSWGPVSADVGPYSSGSYTYSITATDMLGNTATATHTVTWRYMKYCALGPVGMSPSGENGAAVDATSSESTTSSASSPGTLTASGPLTIVNPIASWGVGKWATDAGRTVVWYNPVQSTIVVNLTRPVSSMTSAEQSARIAPLGLSQDLLNSAQSWRLTLTDWVLGTVAQIDSFALRFEEKSSTTLADTDGDGLSDAVEANTYQTLPVARDTDFDGLTDSYEVTPRTITITVNGLSSTMAGVTTVPTNPDTDADGLWDGEESTAGQDGYLTFPTRADTDGDLITDGNEVSVYGTNPAHWDTDADGLKDKDELTSRSLNLYIDGAWQTRTVVTSPTNPDTDSDGLSDGVEWLGTKGYVTDPTDPDTDKDGLSDNEEYIGLNHRPTNPLQSDTDHDGLTDGIDLSPTEIWSLPWTTWFDAGSIRFSQRFRVYDVHGNYAWIFTFNYNPLDPRCNFLSDHTADATRSSDTTPSNVVSQLNDMLSKGGENTYRATAATYVDTPGMGWGYYTYGACDALAPRQYQISYRYDDHTYNIDFMNQVGTTVGDGGGSNFYHALVDVPLTLYLSQSVYLQITIPAGSDRTSTPASGTVTLPALAYSLRASSDFVGRAPFYQNVAVGASLDTHSYEFALRIPPEVARPENVFYQNGQPMIKLDLTPMWLSSDGSTVQKAAFNPTSATVGAVLTKAVESASRLVARFGVNVANLKAALPADISSYSTGYYIIGGFSVYVYRMGTTFDANAVSSATAIYFIGSSIESVASFQDTVTWNPNWMHSTRDGFGVVKKALLFVNFERALWKQVLNGIYSPILTVPTGASEQMTIGNDIITVAHLQDDLNPSAEYYIVSKVTKTLVKIRVAHPELPSVMITETRTIEEPVDSEFVTDIENSRILNEYRFMNIRAALRGVAIGAVLAVFGGQAVLAFASGDALKGTVYTMAAGVAVFGVLKENVVLIDKAFAGRLIPGGVKIKLGAVATLAVGGILASYEVFLASQTSNPIAQLAHYETGAATMIDSFIGATGILGSAALVGWQLGLVITVSVQNLLGILPNQLALQIVSSPGSTIVFFIEYIFASDIPSQVANDALNQFENFLADSARYLNSMSPPQPTMVLVP